MKRIARLLAPVLLGAGLMLGAGATAAHANNGVELCAPDMSGSPSSPCADAYNNGGEYIKSYSPGATWEYIQAQYIGNSQWQLYDFNTGRCLGDANNDPGNAAVGDTDVCPSQGQAGWGTIFVRYNNFCPYGNTYHNNHWNATMGAGVNNGSQWYLNTAVNVYCLVSY